ncbi:MAG: hypothetical protein Mars2KO_23520 [Maribacter sp.]
MLKKMKQPQRILLALFLTIINLAYGQEANENYQNYGKYGDISDGLPERDSLITKCNENDVVTGIGKIAMDGKTPSNIKVGHWREYNASGILVSEGDYKIGEYVTCCYVAYCLNFYHYRSGIWKYYDDKGALSYELEFVPDKVHMFTNCSGGYDILFGLVERIPSEYEDIVTLDTVFKRQKVEQDHPSGSILMVPLNGEVFWE